MRTFSYWGTEISYFYDLYNLTHLNERQVEIAIARWWLDRRRRGEPLLEFGNVLGHYARSSHVVVDRYEHQAWYQHLVGQPVRNVDVMDEHDRYASIVSISTLEHVGMERDAELGGHPGAVAALRHLHGLLVPGGKMLVTFPTGVNRGLDTWAVRVTDPVPARICTIGRGDGDEWVQDEVVTLRPYGAASQHPAAGEWAEGIAVAEFSV